MTAASNVAPRPYVPYKHLVLDMYKAYVRKLLEENPTYWGKFYKRIKCYYICRRVRGTEKNEVEVVISYPEFRKIIEAYFTNAKEMIIEGGELNLGSKLGYISARRVERNLGNKAVNFFETKKQPKDPITGKRLKIVYFEDDDWVRIGWDKTKQLTNEQFYRFEPTNDDNHGGGFKKQLSAANKKNPILKYRYKFYPYITDKIDCLKEVFKPQQSA